MELEKAEIIEIPVENTANFTNTKQTESGIIFKFYSSSISIGCVY